MSISFRFSQAAATTLSKVLELGYLGDDLMPDFWRVWRFWSLTQNFCRPTDSDWSELENLTLTAVSRRYRMFAPRRTQFTR